MITEQDLHEAIAECQGERNPNASTCIKLAAYYTILNNIAERTEEPMYSYAPAPTYQGTSEFAQAIAGKDPVEVLGVMDELMDAVMILNRRLYDSVMRKLK